MGEENRTEGRPLNFPHRNPKKFLRRGEGIARWFKGGEKPIVYPMGKPRLQEQPQNSQVPGINVRCDSGYGEESQRQAIPSQQSAANVPSESSDVGSTSSGDLEVVERNELSGLTEPSLAEYQAHLRRRSWMNDMSQADFEKHEEMVEHNYSGMMQIEESNEQMDANGFMRRSTITRHEITLAGGDQFGTPTIRVQPNRQPAFMPISTAPSEVNAGGSVITSEMLAAMQQRHFMSGGGSQSTIGSVSSQISTMASTPSAVRDATIQRDLLNLEERPAPTGGPFYHDDIVDPMNSVSMYSRRTATIETGSISTTNTGLRRAVVENLTARQQVSQANVIQNLNSMSRAPHPQEGLRHSQTVPSLQQFAQRPPAQMNLVAKPPPSKPHASVSLFTDDREKVLMQKMRELEQVCTKVRADHAEVEENKRFYEMCLKEVADEKEMLLSSRRQMEAERDEHSRRMRHEKLMLDKERNVAKAAGKRENEENKLLREQLLELQNAECERESRASSQRARLKTQFEKTQKELTEAKAELEKVKSRCEKAEKSNTKLEWELQQLRQRLKNRDKMPPIVQCDCEKTAEPGKSPAGILRKSSDPIANDPLDDYPIMGKESNSEGRSKSVRFNVGSDSNSPALFNQPNLQPSTSSGSVSSNSSWNSLETPAGMGSGFNDNRYLVAGQVFSSPVVVPQIQFQQTLSDGSRELTHVNGTVERLNIADGSHSLWFPNGDTKLVRADGVTVYTFSATDTSQTSFPDGTKVIQFQDGHQETYWTDGRVEAKYPDGTTRVILPSGDETMTKADGSRLERKADGTEVVYFADGSKETRSKLYVKREFPDGSHKAVFPDGTQQSFYSSSGRFRIKDAKGTIITDKITQPPTIDLS